tara:strand:- start:737 stop:964 length:228 start_codon:yes stop_codon:yes gene_type:complete
MENLVNHQYFAQIDENNVVIYVSPVTAAYMTENPERYPGTWVETFFDTKGKTYAGVGYTYDPATKDFVAPTTTLI